MLLIFVAIKLLPWQFSHEAGIGPMYVDERTWAVVEELQAARYADGVLLTEFPEFVVDVLTHYRIGLAVLLMGTIALILTIRRRR